MATNNTGFILTTHPSEKSKNILLQITIKNYFLFAVILLIFSGYFFYTFYDTPYLKGSNLIVIVSFIFFILGLLAILFGIQNLLTVETIHIDTHGISITKGRKQYHASWSQLTQIKSWRTFYPSIGYGFISIESLEELIIQTLEWKYVIKEGNFTKQDLKETFFQIARQVEHHSLKIVDALEYLPNQQKFHNGKQTGLFIRLREYKFLLKIGSWMLLIGFFLMLIIILLGQLNSPSLAIAAVLLFFGGILTLVGWGGITEEKKKHYT